MGDFVTKIQNLFGSEDVVQQPQKKTSSGGKSSVVSCAKCPMHGQKPVHSLPNKTAQILVIGSAPSSIDEECNQLFTGTDGILLMDSLRYGGFKPKTDIQFDTVCKCRPTGAQGAFREPVTAEINTCRKLYLDRMIERFDDIIVLGKTAQNVVFDKAKGVIPGNVINFKGKRVAVTNSPSAIIRSKHFEPKAEAHFMADFKFFYSVFLGNYCPKYFVVTDERSRNACLSAILNATEISFDIETTGLELDAMINVVGVGIDDYAFAIPVIGKYSENIEFVKRLFQFKDKLYIGYNTQFDYNLLTVNGLCDRRIQLADAMVMEHMLDSSRGKGFYRLKQVATENGFRWSSLLLNPANPDKFEDLYKYNAEDVINTMALYKKSKEICREKNLIGLAEKVVFPSINVLSEMEYTGIDIDLEEMKRVRVRLVSQIDILEVELSERFGERNWGSTAQIQDLLLTWLKGAPDDVLVETKTKAVCTDEAALKVYQEYSDKSGNQDLSFFCDNMLQLRGLEKLLGTYVDGLAAKIQTDGRLRGHFSLIGTETGRLSSSKPNLQNIPRDGRIKTMFVAPDGWTLLEADASQIELRVVACVAPEPIMIEAYNDNQDLHRLTASAVLGIALDKVVKSQRQTAKAVNFGFIYGQSWQGFKNYAKATFGVILTDDQAQKFRQAYFDKYYGIKSWHERVAKEIFNGGRLVITVFNRRRPLKGEKEGHLIRQALNTPVQSPASDCNLIAMRHIWDAVDYTRCRFALTVHDQCMLVVRNDYLEEVVDIVYNAGRHVNARCSWLKVPFVLDIKTGQNWGRMKELKK